MAEILERVTRIEATLEHHGSLLNSLNTKVDDLHEYILLTKGTLDARKEIARERHYLTVGIAAITGAAAGFSGSLIALLNRFSHI